GSIKSDRTSGSGDNAESRDKLSRLTKTHAGRRRSEPINIRKG
ncbi:CLUMA_CG016352, isoform A, partial [Clunio marinus]